MGADADRPPAGIGATAVRAASDTPTVATPSHAPPVPSELVPGTVVANRYRIVARLGRGGMGVVFRADDLRLGQTVALKFLTEARSPERERQLLDEVRLGREVSHPNVCRVHDVVDFGGQLFISMEYIDGEDLQSLLRRIGRLPHDKALVLAREICAGLAAAHARGILHRDLKPANIMVDGHGRARITDFGLAAFESGQAHGVLSGTPAYMAPEQLGHQQASVASDVFALGLTLFELWTGRRIFTGTSLSEIVEQHRIETARSSVRRAQEMDATVRAVIDLCLDPDPVRRPGSVRAVLALLPGRDALDAAISAGETPSPGMVAAADEQGDLSRKAAWLALAAVLASLLAIAAVWPRSTLEGQVGLPHSSAVLESRAERLIADAGWTSAEAPRRDGESWFFVDPTFVRSRERRIPAALHASPAQAMRFMVRQSPAEMIPRKGTSNYRVTATDPEFDRPGMVTVILAADGSLRRFAVVPPPLTTDTRGPRWPVLFAAARLDPAAMTPVAYEDVCPVDNDRKLAWTGRDPIDGTPIRIEAAALRGRPVWFSVISPWAEALRTVPKPPGVGLAEAMTFALLALLPLTVAFLARRNLRRGQGDRRAATRFAIAVFVAMMAANVVHMHHVSNYAAESENLVLLTAIALLLATGGWFFYIASEPFARKRWPRLLISWVRLLEGRWRDPMVGRDLLIGLAAGGLLALTAHLLAAIAGSGADTLRIQLSGLAFSSPKHVAFYYFYNLAEAIARAAALLAFLVMLRGLLRNQAAAVTVAIVIVALANLDFPIGPLPSRLAMMFVTSAVTVLLTLRFGLIALSASAWMFLTALRLPLTLDTQAWYFGRSLLTMSVIAALALFAFVVSLGEKAILPGPVFEE